MIDLTIVVGWVAAWMAAVCWAERSGRKAAEKSRKNGGSIFRDFLIRSHCTEKRVDC